MTLENEYQRQILVSLSRIEENQQLSLEVSSAVAIDIALLKKGMADGHVIQEETNTRLETLAHYEEREHTVFKVIGAFATLVGAIVVGIITSFFKDK